MSFEYKEGQFSLFKNDKEGNESRPDYSGKIKINGKEMQIAAWIKEGKNGKFMSGKVSEFQNRTNEVRKELEPDFDDSLPPF